MNTTSRRMLAVLALFALAPFANGRAQEVGRRVTGTVTDAAGQELPDATVTVVGTRVGGRTDERGKFNLLVPPGGATLRARRIGYRGKEATISATETTVNFSLVKDVLQLETQVITGQGTSVARLNAANDIAQIAGEDMNRAHAQTIEQAMQGKLVGAAITTNSGVPGGGAQVQIRGVNSVFGNANPLYVIDGIIISNDVVQPAVNAFTSAGGGIASSQDNGANRIADFNPADIESIEVLKGASAAAIYGSKAANGVILIRTKTGSTSGRARWALSQGFGTYQLNRKLGARHFNLADATASGASVGLSAATVAANYASCNGFCDFEQQYYGEEALATVTNLSVSAGTANTKVFASGLISSDPGIQSNTGFEKQSFRLNITQLVGSRLTLDLSSNFVHTRTRRGISGNDNIGSSPYFVFGVVPSWFDMRKKADGTYPDVGPFGAFNPFQVSDEAKPVENVYRVVTGGTATLSLYSDVHQTLTARLNGGLDYFDVKDDNLFPVTLQQIQANTGSSGLISQNYGTSILTNLNLGLTHSYAKAGWFTATTAAGVQREQRYFNTTALANLGIIPGQVNIDKGSVPSLTQTRVSVNDFAWYLQEDLLLLNERLLISAGVRSEKSTNNGEVDTYYTFPKGAISYRLPSIWKMDNLKLRVAAGQSGNQPTYGQKYTNLASGVYGGGNVLVIGGQLGAAKIKPETQTELEGGIDASFLNSRVALTVTTYLKTIDDLIVQRTLAPSLGQTIQILNGGQLQNKGIEIGLNLIPIQRRSFDWTSRITFSSNQGTITRLDVPTFNVGAFGFGFGQGRIAVGESPTQIVGRWKPVCTPACARITSALGNTLPDWQMGFGNEFRIGNFRAYGFVDWRKGGNAINLTLNSYDGSVLTADSLAGVARLNSLNAGLSPYIQDATFVKLREISLSYELPSSMAGRIFPAAIGTVRLELSGRNLAIWSGYGGIDPEVSNFGNQNVIRGQDVAPFPPSRSYFLTVYVGF